MEKSFIFESDHFASPGNPNLCRRFEVIFQIVSSDEDSAYPDGIFVWDLELDCETRLDEFPEREQGMIETRAQEIADENAYDVWFDGQLSAADALYDAWKDGDR